MVNLFKKVGRKLTAVVMATAMSILGINVISLNPKMASYESFAVKVYAADVTASQVFTDTSTRYLSQSAKTKTWDTKSGWTITSVSTSNQSQFSGSKVSSTRAKVVVNYPKSDNNVYSFSVYITVTNGSTAKTFTLPAKYRNLAW